MKNLLRALCVSSLLASTGCVLDQATIHAGFARFEPSEIAILPVENRTYLDLSRVTTAGLAQRLINIGVRDVNAPLAIREGFLDAINRKGYGARLVEPEQGGSDSFRGPLPPGKTAPYDAVLICDIRNWRKVMVSEGEGFEFSGQVEVIRVGEASQGGGEVLYRNMYFRGLNAGGNSIRTAGDLEADLQRIARVVLASFPAKGQMKVMPPEAAPGAPPGR